jgi:hypothetical protein
MVLPTPEDPEGFALPELFLVAPSLSGLPEPSARSFYALDGNQALSAAFRNTSFVEYPTIHIYGAGDFKGTIVNRQGTITRVIEEDRPAMGARKRVVRRRMTLLPVWGTMPGLTTKMVLRTLMVTPTGCILSMSKTGMTLSMRKQMMVTPTQQRSTTMRRPIDS